jgi:hypothetical protein
MLDLDMAQTSSFMEHKDKVDMLHGIVTFIDNYQKGVGIVAVSPR